jgi:hypothetical protein
MKEKDAEVCFILLEMIEVEVVMMYSSGMTEDIHGNSGHNISSM